MSVRSLAFAVAVTLAGIGSASAQYDLGPDYTSMINNLLQQGDYDAQQARAMEMHFVQQNMNNPEVQRMYNEHQAQGGQLSFPDYAYLWGATAGFTPEGIAYFMQVEQDNARKEQMGLINLREAERATSEALGQMHQRQFEINNERGLLLGGQGTYVDDRTGTEVPLSYMQPGVPQQDPQTGQFYMMDEGGTQHVLGADGLWYPMTSKF